jgi:hypothetical protein
MPNRSLGFLSSDGALGAAILDQIRSLDAAPPDVTHTSADDSGVLASDRDQLERDYAAIEHATAVLRRAEPTLQSWTGSPASATAQQPRPVWMLIGMLWVSTAIVTLGAVYAISALVG